MPMRTLLLIAVLTMASLAAATAPADAEGDRAGDLQPRTGSEQHERSSVRRDQKTADVPRTSKPQSRIAKPAPQHRRDFGYSGFVGKSF